jgi:hypothetical protein
MLRGSEESRGVEEGRRAQERPEEGETREEARETPEEAPEDRGAPEEEFPTLEEHDAERAQTEAACEERCGAQSAEAGETAGAKGQGGLQENPDEGQEAQARANRVTSGGPTQTNTAGSIGDSRQWYASADSASRA